MTSATDTKTVTTDTDATRPDKWWQFKPGNKPRNRTQFKSGHKPHPAFTASIEFKRLKRRLASALKKEYGPELTASQLAYIDNAADAGARLELLDISVHPLAIANLQDARRHALQALEGDD